MFSFTFSYLFCSQHVGMYTHSHSTEDLTRTQAKIMGSVNKNRARVRKSISRESGPGKDKNGQRYR